MKRFDENDGDDARHMFDSNVIACRKCPRLVWWREHVAQQKVKRYRETPYWGKPVTSFGPWDAELLIVGLAPAAHGANRTGRMFTGDRSGEWLYAALYDHGFASSPDSIDAEDGMELYGTRITAVAHCVPPNNRLLRSEVEACHQFLSFEIRWMLRLKVIVSLGRLAYDRITKILPPPNDASYPSFHHGASYRSDGAVRVLASYHPSQQNTFTGRLTHDMFWSMFAEARLELQRIHSKDRKS